LPNGRRRNDRHFGRRRTFGPAAARRIFLPDDRIVAVGLLTQQDVDALGPAFHRLWPVEDVPCFGELVEAIDEAERSRDRPPVGSPQRT
jgi:hypothetical protein